tara:strand:+ start:116 stop:424 length:309 start_codon:yes stop_codon:yes gene_type:complete
MMLSPDFNPYGGEWFETIADLTSEVEHLSEKSEKSEAAPGYQGSQGAQGAAGSFDSATGLPVVPITDTVAMNNTIYYSLTQKALVFKDDQGRVFALGITKVA